MGQRLAEQSDSQLIIQIYPNQQLGTERECLELLQIGSIDITKASGAVLENFVEDYRVLSLPYLFRDKEHQFQVLDGPVGDDLLEAGAPYWLQGLGFYDSGSRSFLYQRKAYPDSQGPSGTEYQNTGESNSHGHGKYYGRLGNAAVFR